MTIGERIKEYADSRGIKNRFLAEKAGVTDSKMSRILNGESNPTVIEYFYICKALELPMEFFVEDNHDQAHS